MKIEVWSDFVCPFCYIGKQRLEMALNQFPYKDHVDIEFKSFELDPNAPIYTEKDIYESLAAKFGTSEEQVKKMNLGLIQQAAEIGLTFNYDSMKPTNTFEAHRLAKLAKSIGKEKTLTDHLMRGYFTESKNIGDKDTLVDIAQASGIDRNKALEVLNDETAYSEDVKNDQRLAQQLGVSGVPFFLLNRKYAISGAQPIQSFASALQKVWEEENSIPNIHELTLNSEKAAVCTDESCVLPSYKESN